MEHKSGTGKKIAKLGKKVYNALYFRHFEGLAEKLPPALYQSECTSGARCPGHLAAGHSGWTGPLRTHQRETYRFATQIGKRMG